MPGLDSLAFAFVALTSSLNPAPAETGKVSRFKEETLKGAEHGYDRLMVSSRLEDLKETKISPKGEWLFPRVTTAFGRIRPDSEFQARFRVFTENEADQIKLGNPTAKTLARFWDMLRYRLSLEHYEGFRYRLVDVFLTSKGQAGGEQMFGEDPFELDEFGKRPRVMMIYIYQVNKWNRPIDRVRELAHEYGQTTLPKASGYPMPEPWTNGILGETLFLTWTRSLLAAGSLQPADVFNITVPELDVYLAEKATPRLRKAALEGPRPDLLKTRSLASFDAWIGLHLWAESILPVSAFSRGLRLGSGEEKAELAPKGLAEGASEQESWEFTVPSWTGGKPIWIPLAKGTATGAKVLKRDPSGWAQIQPTAGVVRVKNPPLQD